MNIFMYYQQDAVTNNLQMFMLSKLQLPEGYPIVESRIEFCNCLKISLGGNSPSFN